MRGFCFEDEPGKQVRSAITIKNTCKSHVAFKVWFMSLFVYSVLYLYSEKCCLTGHYHVTHRTLFRSLLAMKNVENVCYSF